MTVKFLTLTLTQYANIKEVTLSTLKKYYSKLGASVGRDLSELSVHEALGSIPPTQEPQGEGRRKKKGKNRTTRKERNKRVREPEGEREGEREKERKEGSHQVSHWSLELLEMRSFCFYPRTLGIILP